MFVSTKQVPKWVTLTSTGFEDNDNDDADHHDNNSILLNSGQRLRVDFDITTPDLHIGMQSSSIVFRVQDADYPDCRYYADLSVQVSVLLSAGDCKDSSRSIDSTTGKCICGTGRVEIGQACIGLGVLLAIVACLVVVFPLLALYIRAWHRAQKADAMWRIDATELKFDEPPVLIGQGGFSVVHMAEYRGTQVAVKKLNSAIHRRKDRFTAMEEGQPSSTQFTRTDSPRHSIRSRGYSVHDHSEASETRSSCVEFGVRSPPICFEADMRLLTSLRHPCLTTIMGALVTKKNEHLLVMEYMEHGTLWDLLHNETVDFEGDLVLSILSDITQGIQFLHNMKPQVIHGDIKSHNILIDTKMRAKLSDFGITYKSALKGTPQWMAPELIHNKNGNTMASDVYALGVVLYEIYARKEPYVDDDLFTVLQEVSDPSVNKRPETPTSMPPLVSALMHDCLLADPDERPTLDEIATRVRRFSPNDVEPIGLPKRHKAGEKNFELLLKVFPRHIAEALRDGREVPPEHHDSVTIFFSDIVGFTKIATELPPEKVSDLLHRLFYSFDTLAEAKGVFKVCCHVHCQYYVYC